MVYACESSDSVPPKARLRTTDDCRRFLANIINKLHRGELEPIVAGRIGYLTNILTNLIKTEDLERRVAALEKGSQQNG